MGNGESIWHFSVRPCISKTVMTDLLQLGNTVDNLQQPLLASKDCVLDRWIMALQEEEQLGIEANDEDSMLSNTIRELDGLDRVQDSTNVSMSLESNHWYSNDMLIIAMLSNFSTSYNVVNISLVLPILQQVTNTSSTKDAASVASSLLAGMMFGQVFGGALGDYPRLGRLGALRLVMCLQLVASLGSAFVDTSGTAILDVYDQLTLWRFLLGVGAGGVYPLAAVLSAEQGESTDAESLHRVVLTFSMQGVGFLTVPLLTVPLLYTVSNLNTVWRIILGLGSLPGFALLLLQWHWYRKQQTGEILPASDPEQDAAFGQESSALQDSDGEVGTCLDSGPNLENDSGSESTQIVIRHGWLGSIRHEDHLFSKLMGTAGAWFLFDVLFYGNTLFQPIVLEAAFGTPETSNARQLLQRTALNSLFLTSIAFPGYAIADLVMGKKTLGVTQTPRYVMMQGFTAMFLLYLTIGVFWRGLKHYPVVLVTLYGLTFFFANYGPNTTTFVLPSLVYSVECRSTLNGISAAAGKLGAWTGATLFAPAASRYGNATVMIMCAVVSVVALALTKLFVKVKAPHGHHHANHSAISPEEIQ